MTQLPRVVWAFLHRGNRQADDRGQTLVEYGLLLAFIAIVVIAALVFLGPVVSQIFQDVGNTLQ